MNKAYARINWVNYPSTDTALNETNLNRMDLALDTIDDRVITLDTTKANESDLLTCVASISFNSTTGIMTITLKNGTVGTIDTGLSKLAINFDYDEDPTSPHYQQIILEMKDGTYKYIDLSALITQYEFSNTSTIAFTVGTGGVISASVIDGSITADKLQPNYLADIIVEVGKAQTAATNAGNSATLAESYAVGGTGTRTGEDTDNAKYYCEQAALIAGQTLGGLSDVTLTSPSDGQVLTYDSNSDEWVNRDVATDLTDLGDVNLTTPTDGQALIYDGASQKWVNGNVTNKVATPVPKVKSYTYDGTDQTFEWISLDTKHITVAGDVRKNAGTYTVTATLKNTEDFWDDFTTAPKTFSWSIAKANQTFNLSANSVSLTSATPTRAVIISGITGDGTFSVSSSNTGVATATVSENVISITGVSNGSATITVTKAATTNYNALSKTIATSVSLSISITFSIESAANDTITVYDSNNNPVFSSGLEPTTNNNGSGTVTMDIPSNGATYKFVSAKAKTPPSMASAYEKSILLTSSTTSVKFMPYENYTLLNWFGNECADVSGGWSAKATGWDNGFSFIAPSVTKSNGKTTISLEKNTNDAQGIYITNNKINLSQRTTLYVYGSASHTGSGQVVTVWCESDAYPINIVSGSGLMNTNGTNPINLGVYSKAISESMKTNKHIAIGFQANQGAYYKGTEDLYAMWAE